MSNTLVLKNDTPIMKFRSNSNRTNISLADLVKLIKESASKTDLQIVTLSKKIDDYYTNMNVLITLIEDFSAIRTELKKNKNTSLRNEIIKLRNKVCIHEKLSDQPVFNCPIDVIQKSHIRLQ